MKRATEDIENDQKNKHRAPYFGNYSENDLQLALEEIRSGLSTCGAAGKKFNIPRETLRRRLKGISSGQHGKSTTLSEAQEKELIEWILLHAANGSPKTKQEIVKAAGEIAALHPDPSMHFKGGNPGKLWMAAFLKRHPIISKRTPEALGRASASVTPESLKRFFDRVYNQLKDDDKLYLLNRPDLWWNCDESGFELNPMPKKVYARKGAKTVHNIERGKPKEMITTTYAVSGD